MRRKDREIKDYSKMLEIIDQCDCIRIGFQEQQGTYQPSRKSSRYESARRPANFILPRKPKRVKGFVDFICYPYEQGCQMGFEFGH